MTPSRARDVSKSFAGKLYVLTNGDVPKFSKQNGTAVEGQCRASQLDTTQHKPTRIVQNRDVAGLKFTMRHDPI